MREAGFEVADCWGFNRVGGLGWRVSGQILRKTTLSAGQMRIFEWLMPVVRVLEKTPFHSHNSVIVVGIKPKDGAAPAHNRAEVSPGVHAAVSP
jgi:hypothetical protein